MSGGEVLASLIREDLRSVPAAALSAALTALSHEPLSPQHHLAAALAALAAGEPKRALWHLDQAPQPTRIAAAATAWALQLDGNWYPGGVGAETTTDVSRAFVTPAPGDYPTELLEHLVTFGPTGLATPRTLLEMSLRNGAATGSQQALHAAWSNLDNLIGLANRYGLRDMAHWAGIAGADMARRGGMLPQADAALANARNQFANVGDAASLALSHLVEGDWWAAPGTSTEAMGWDLAPLGTPSTLPSADFHRAASCYAAAVDALGALDLPRMHGALALRRALVARATGDHEGRRRELALAAQAYAASGDQASVQLVAIHSFIADIDEGRLGQHALDLGGGWHPPTRGPIADLLAWTATVGSRSWCVGLGRLLERCAGQWNGAGSLPRARIAYLAALSLISIDDRVPTQTFVTAVAYADSRSNLTTNALIRLERAFGPMFADPGLVEPFEFAQKLEATLVVVKVLRERARGPASAQVVDRMNQLRAEMLASLARMRELLPPVSGPLPTTQAELQAAVARMRGPGSLESQAGTSDDAVVLMQQMQLATAEQTIGMLDVLAPLTMAENALRSGRTAEADGWFTEAVEAARGPTADVHLLPLALITAQRLDEARTELDRAEQAGSLPDGMLLQLYVSAEEHERAAVVMARMDAAGEVPQSWQELHTRAQVQLATGRLAEARVTAEQAIAAFESSVRLVLRDPERLEACDQPDVAAMYATLARTHLGAADASSPDESSVDASLEAAELARSLSYDVGLDRVDPVVRQGWQRAAGDYAALASRIVVEVPTATPEQAAQRFSSLDHADAALAEAEHALDASDPGILLRRTTPGVQPTAADLRRRLPEGTLLLEYLTVGQDVLCWAMTRETMQPLQRRVSQRGALTAMVRSLHAGCAIGPAPETALAALLVEPFADLLRSHPRVVVVPFGPLTLVPFHALRLDGRPLGLTHVVSYAPRAATLLQEDHTLDQLTGTARPLVVGDPAFDPAVRPSLKDLPGSRTEAVAVAATLRVPAEDVLVGEAATETAVSERLEASDLVHLSTHGHLDELSPFASSLVLAGPDELTVADIAGLRFGTDLAVLSGCDTGRGSATLGGDLVGLTRSLLRSGVRRTVVSMWPVDDEVAPVLMQRFYSGISTGLAPAYALAGAQRQLSTMSLDAIRAAYVDLGGEPSATGHARRRGVVLDADLRDDEEIPEPLDGSAERFWASFILVG